MNTKYLLLGAMAGCLAADAAAADSAAQKKIRKDSRPNIIIIMADDMGYSDIGCFGSEIPTPNIDALAQDGLRYTQFYNTGRSCPSRASLLTGLYAQQAGIGRMSEDPGSQPDKNPKTPPAYQGYLNDRCVTIAEVLKSAGYDTYMAGKWHVGMHGEEKWPLQRGFDRFYGILAGACNYLQPKGGRGLTLDNTRLDVPCVQRTALASAGKTGGHRQVPAQVRWRLAADPAGQAEKTERIGYRPSGLRDCRMGIPDLGPAHR